MLNPSLNICISASLLFCGNNILISVNCHFPSLLNPTAGYKLPYFCFIPLIRKRSKASPCDQQQAGAFCTLQFIFSLHFLLPSHDCIFFNSHVEQPNVTLLPLPQTLSKRHSVSVKYPMRELITSLFQRFDMAWRHFSPAP